MILRCGRRQLDLTTPQVMGILNVTPDSFYDGGRYTSLDSALDRAEIMVKEGAAIIDVGGESTRPGATPLSLQEEIDRVIPIVAALCKNFSVVISVDTRTPQVMQEAIRAGASFINDVNALQAEGTLAIVAEQQVAVCLMHMQGEPVSMQQSPYYEDVVHEVKDFLAARVRTCLAAGVAPDCIVVDPGFGFGKSLTHNLQMLNQLEQFRSLELPLLVGFSRKSMVGSVLGLPTEQRLYGSLALAVLAVTKGAALIRTHDVRPTIEAIKMTMGVITI